MVIKDINHKVIGFKDIKNKKLVRIENSIIETINLIGEFEIKTELYLEGCIISNLNIHSCWFISGLTLKNCIIKGYVDYQMGGHNKAPIVFQNNVFQDFFNFFDCQFNNTIKIENCIFVKGSNLLGNKNEGYTNIFEQGYEVFGNIGNISVDGFE